MAAIGWCACFPTAQLREEDLDPVEKAVEGSPVIGRDLGLRNANTRMVTQTSHC